MFMVEERDAVRDWMLRLAEVDDRVAVGALVGSLAAGAGDRFSDLDVTFGIVDQVVVRDVLDDWTARLVDELHAVRLVDLVRDPAIYRVFLLPGALQLDLSMMPAGVFRAAGPSFRLLFGSAAADSPASAAPPPGALFISTPAVAADVFGWGVIYALHARACVERRRPFQAEHYLGAVRDHALSLACLRHGLSAIQARQYDALPAETLRKFEHARPAATRPAPLRAALAICVRELLREGVEAEVEGSDVVADRLSDLR